VIRFGRIVFVAMLLSLPLILSAQDPHPDGTSIPLPTSKILTVPTPGRIASTNSFPATIALSPDAQYAALLNNGYGTQETLATQSIAVLDLKTNHLSDYPDNRFGDESHQSYFLGLVFPPTESISTRQSAQSPIPRARSQVTLATESPFTPLPREKSRPTVSSPSNRSRSRSGKKSPSPCRRLQREPRSHIPPA
jgi:hypothetical protein